jgi:hypothetical protein
MIFSKESGFTADSQLGYNEAGLNRLNARFKVFMEPFKKEFEGHNVLDLASHDGRWSYAALMLGAAHVTGIEARPELIKKGEHIFQKEAFRGRTRFIAGDVFEVMPDLQTRNVRFDVVLCLGLFYHVMDHFRLMKLMDGFHPRIIILDTGLIDDDKPYISLDTEPSDQFLNTISAAGERDTLVGLVSKGGLRLMASSLGYEYRFLDWNAAKFSNKANLQDYFSGGLGQRRRYSVLLRKTSSQESPRQVRSRTR